MFDTSDDFERKSYLRAYRRLRAQDIELIPVDIRRAADKRLLGGYFEECRENSLKRLKELPNDR